jgi:hypothetical protein
LCLRLGGGALVRQTQSAPRCIGYACSVRFAVSLLTPLAPAASAMDELHPLRITYARFIRHCASRFGNTLRRFTYRLSDGLCPRALHWNPCPRRRALHRTSLRMTPQPTILQFPPRPGRDRLWPPSHRILISDNFVDQGTIVRVLSLPTERRAYYAEVR